VTARKLLPRVLVVLALLLAVYEAVAIFSDWVPTITEVVQGLPGVAELLIIGPVIVWLVWHFGWLTPGDKPPFGQVAEPASAEKPISYVQTCDQTMSAIGGGTLGPCARPSGHIGWHSSHVAPNGQPVGTRWEDGPS